MNETKETLTTCLILFLVVKVIDFTDKNIFDYILLSLAAVYMILDIIFMLRNRHNNGIK